MTRRKHRGALGREAATAFSVFVLLLNILTGTLSHAHYGAEAGLPLSHDGGKMAICSGTQMVFVDRDGNQVPAPQQEQGRECACCLLMQANAVMPPPPSAPAPLELAAIQLQPGDALRLDAAAAPALRNRDPPSQA